MEKGSPPKPPHPGDLIKRIRRLAKEGRISWSYHAGDDRSPLRDMELVDVLEIFRLGDIVGKITPGKRRGSWKCLVVGYLHWTTREAGVVTEVRKNRLVPVTVEWIDP